MNVDEIDVDLWISCGECLTEIEDMHENGHEISPLEYAQQQVGVEIETNSLVVSCKRHDTIIKLFRLHESEVEIIPKGCTCCDE
jgi:hypothetical protein